MTTIDFLHKVQYRGRLENPREAKQAIRIIFNLVRRCLGGEEYLLKPSLPEDIRTLWNSSPSAYSSVNWFEHVESEISANNLQTTSKDLIKAVLSTVRETVGFSNMRSIANNLPEDVRAVV